MKDMSSAIDLILSAMDREDPITIYGDYDADGLTATALLSEAILLPFFNGKLIRAPGAGGPTGKLLADSWRAWEFTSLNGDLDHYPGMQFAQFLAYYNDRGGLYLACEDTEGNVKRFRALHREPGVRLGVAHVGDWPRRASASWSTTRAGQLHGRLG